MAPGMKNAPSPLTAVFGDAQFGTVSFNSGDDEGKCKAVDQEGQTEEIQVNHGNTQTRSIAVAEVGAASAGALMRILERDIRNSANMM